MAASLFARGGTEPPPKANQRARAPGLRPSVEHRRLARPAPAKRDASAPPQLHAAARAWTDLCYLAKLPSMQSDRVYEARAEILKAMAHPSRLKMLDALEKGERCVCELQKVVGSDLSP